MPPLGFPAWSLRWPAAAAAHASLMPLLELHSVATQPALLAKLTRRVALRAAEEARKTGQTNEEKETEEDEHLQTFQNVSDPDDAEAVSAIVEAASSGMAFGVAAAPRDPSDFAAHRHVLWLLADDPSANGTRRRRASAEASLPALAGSAWRSWHASCWGGAGETMPLAHAPRAFRKRRVVGEAPKDDATFESDVAACHAASRWRAAEGPRRREVALATGIATALVGEGCGATGVAARAIRTAQLRLAARARVFVHRRLARRRRRSGRPSARSSRRFSSRTPPPPEIAADASRSRARRRISWRGVTWRVDTYPRRV